MQNVYRALHERLARNADVLGIDGRTLASGKGWQQLARFRPHIVHYVAGPSNKSVVLTAAIRLISRATATVMSSIHPVGITPRVMRALAPDLMLTQAHDTELFYQGLGIQTRYLPNGVAKQRFTGVSEAERSQLRQQYGLPTARRIALHVGHLKRGRNVKDLVALQDSQTQVLIVASPATQPEPGVREELENAGILVWTHYLPRIEDIYRMADVYVFPVEDRKHCIELPLSVMEAAAVGLPIITKAFGALPRIYAERRSFRYYAHPAQLPQLMSEIQAPGGELRRRTPDWDDVAQELFSIYEGLLSYSSKPSDAGKAA
jgi:glycosyltransferase involved in cell wall biosynthesis